MLFHERARYRCAKDLFQHSDTIIIYLANSSWVRLIYVNLMRHRLVLQDQTHAGQHLRLTSHPLWLTSLLKCAIINDQHLFLFNVSVSVCPSSSPSLPPLLNSCGFVSLCSGMLGWPQLCGWSVQTRRPHLSLCMHSAHPYLRTTVRQDSAA